MKITKYPQSNLIVEENGKRLMIDPGIFTFEKFSAEEMGSLDAILITHQHPDHFDPNHIAHFSALPIYANADVATLAADSGIKIREVENGVSFEVEGFQITPVDLPHCKMIDGSDGPPNTGYVINETFFHPGDGIELNGLEVNSAGIPITGPTINNERAWSLAKALKVTKVIPIHYSNPKYTPDVEGFKQSSPENVEVILLEDGQSTEL